MRDAENIRQLLALQPDYMGFIFYEKSKRFVGTALDEELLRSFPKSVRKVGVFVNATQSYILEMVKIKGYGTRFARVVSRAKARAKAWIMHSLCSCFLKIKSINTSLVDTR